MSASKLVCEFFLPQSDLSEFGIFPGSHSSHCDISELLYIPSSHDSEEISNYVHCASICFEYLDSGSVIAIPSPQYDI